jgi:hypothetical protein
MFGNIWGKADLLLRKPAYLCYSYQPSIVDASKNFVRGWVESVYKEKSIIEIGARLGLRKWYSKSEDIAIIIPEFIGVRGSAIIFALGLILYRMIIEPLVKKKLKANGLRL